MAFRIYNTMTRSKEELLPADDKHVRMYTCGPTVYNYAHIGNFRAYMFEDLLRRYIKFCGFKVTQVQNLTDVDDKTIRSSIEQGMPLKEYTKKYIDAFFADLGKLNIEPAEYYPAATDYIPEMISTGAVPDGVKWGSYPTMVANDSNSPATLTYNVMVHSFTPVSLKGIIFLSSESMIKADQGRQFGAEMTVLANCWKAKFGDENVPFIYTTPNKALVPGITAAEKIKGKHKAFEITNWSDLKNLFEAINNSAFE